MLNGLLDLTGGGVLATFAIVVVIVLLVIYISRRYQIAGPNEALIIAGARGSKVRQQSGEVAALADDGIRVVVGAGAIVIPIINRPFRLSLQTYPSAINLDDGVTAQGIRVKVNATAVFKIGRQPTQIRAAAERFIGQEDQIEPTVQQVLIGSLRSIVGKLHDRRAGQGSPDAHRPRLPRGEEGARAARHRPRHPEHPGHHRRGLRGPGELYRPARQAELPDGPPERRGRDRPGRAEDHRGTARPAAHRRRCQGPDRRRRAQGLGRPVRWPRPRPPRR